MPLPTPINSKSPPETDSGPHAFVLMPFVEELDTIYDLAIRPGLQTAGFNVRRADEIQNQQSILRDVVSNIADATLVVADLSGLNPNVLYELGIAHALNRPVILLTQNIDELPFDLRQDRAIRYGTQVADALRAKQELEDRAAGLLRGGTVFGSPVSEALNRPVDLPSIGDSDDTAADAGLLDHQDEATGHLNEMATLLKDLTDATTQLGDSLRRQTEGLNRSTQSGSRPDASEIREFLRTAASTIDIYATTVSTVNDQYQPHLPPLRKSLESMVWLQFAETEEQREEFGTALESLEGMRDSALTGLGEMENLASAMENLPPIEKEFNRARRRASRETRKLTANINETVKIADSAAAIGRKRLAELDTRGT